MASQEKSKSDDPYLRANNARIDAGKWLITALGAIGAVLIAGIQLSGVGELTPPFVRSLISSDNIRFFGAVVFAFIGLLMVGWAIWSAIKIMTPELYTFKDLLDDDSIRTNAVFQSDLYGSFGSNLDEFVGQKEAVLELAKQSKAGKTPGEIEEIRIAKIERETVRGIEKKLTNIGSFVTKTEKFNRQIKTIFWCCITVTVSIMGFSVLLKSPGHSTYKTLPKISVEFSETGWLGYIEKAGIRCKLVKRENISAILLGTLSETEFNVLTLPVDECRAVQVNLSKKIGKISE